MPNSSNRLLLVGILFALSKSASVQAANTRHTGAVPVADSDALATHAEGALRVVEGDILMGPRMMQKGIGVHAGVGVWQDGVVPYYFDPDLALPVIEVIEKAINTWNRSAGITLIEIDPNDADSPRDYIHFVPASGCASWIGRQGGPQTIWVAPNCSSGSMMHEIGHALGLEHEHTRPDRDQYISINWQNIDADKADNFDHSTEDKTVYGDYDYASIMHYGEYFFSVNGEPTIQPLNEGGKVIGQRVAPSEGDIAAIAELYASDVSLVSNVVHIDGQSEVSLLISNEYAQGSNQLEIHLDTGTAQLVSVSNNEWQCVAGDEHLKCARDRLAGHAQSAIVLLLDQEIHEQELHPTLKSKSPDENQSNNAGVFSPAAASTALHDHLYEDDQLHPATGGAGGGGAGFALFGLLMLFSGNRAARKS